jgi:hypothetical protein
MQMECAGVAGITIHLDSIRGPGSRGESYGSCVVGVDRRVASRRIVISHHCGQCVDRSTRKDPKGRIEIGRSRSRWIAGSDHRNTSGRRRPAVPHGVERPAPIRGRLASLPCCANVCACESATAAGNYGARESIVCECWRCFEDRSEKHDQQRANERVDSRYSHSVRQITGSKVNRKCAVLRIKKHENNAGKLIQNLRWTGTDTSEETTPRPLRFAARLPTTGQAQICR